MPITVARLATSSDIPYAEQTESLSADLIAIKTFLSHFSVLTDAVA